MAAGHRILVVDDNAIGRESLADVLRLAGHEVSEAADGPAALGLARDFRPRIVLVDIGLPGMDGFDVAVRLRNMPEIPDAILIALTGFAHPDIAARAGTVGFNHHVVKPVHPKDLESLFPPVS